MGFAGFVDFQAVILAAGRGTRMGRFCEVFNKALLPINGKPVICQLVEKLAHADEIVVALGHEGPMVRTFLETAFPERRFAFVEVDRYMGAGSGPGYSLLACRNAVRGAFVFFSVDTIVTDPVPAPDRNWFGVATVEDTSRFCSCRTDETGRVVGIDDKVKSDNPYAFIGLAGVHDHAVFWRSLEGDETLISNERQVSRGFVGLMNSPSGMFVERFDWWDTGTPETYEEARVHFRHHPERF